MSASVDLYSTHLITEKELMDVIREASGVVTPEGPYFGRLSQGNTHVWIIISEPYNGVFDYKGEPFDQKEVALLDQAKEIIGGEFQTWLSILLSRKSGSQSLAVRFAYTCCQHWPCVVDNDEKRLFSCEEIAKLQEEGGGFTTYGL